MLGIYHMEDFREVRGPLQYQPTSFRTNKKVGPTVKRAVACAGRAGPSATAASPPTIHRILMATVRHLQECRAARVPGWTELLSQPAASTPPLSQTVLSSALNADTARLRSGDVGVDDLRQGTRHRRRPAQHAEADDPPNSPTRGVG